MTLIGRDAELRRVDESLRSHPVGVVVGPVGVGKSALLDAVLGRVDGRTELVDAGHASGAGEILRRIAETIGVDHELTDDADQTAATLARRLVAAEVELLALDQVDDHCDAVLVDLATVVDRAPDLRLLVASRTHPRRPGAVVIPLRPWAVEVGADGGPAVELFHRRYTEAGGDLAELAAEPDLVARLLRATGGLPLAILLEASRAALVGLRLACDIAVTEPSGASSRHVDEIGDVLGRSLRDLDGDCLAVFEAVGAFEGSPEPTDVAMLAAVTPDVALRAVEDLVRRSLVTVAGGRVAMLPPVRRLARTLAFDGDRTTVLAARREAWARAVCTRRPALTTREVLAIEADLAATVASCVAGGCPRAAVPVVVVLDDALRADLRHRRRVELLEPLLAAARATAPTGVPGDEEDAVLELQRLTAMAVADAASVARALTLLDEAATMATAARRPSLHAGRIAALRASLAFETGDLRAALAAARQAIEDGGAASDDASMCSGLKTLADVALESGDLDDAVNLARDAVRGAPDPSSAWRAYAMATVAACELERGAHAVALATARTLADDARSTGDLDLLVEADWLTAMADPSARPFDLPALTGDRAGTSTLHIQADIAAAIRALAEGRTATAMTLAADCEHRAGALPMVPLQLDAAALVGDAATIMGEHVEAERAHTSILKQASMLGMHLRVADALDGLAGLLAASHTDRWRAERCRAAAAAIRDHRGAGPRRRPWRADPAETVGVAPGGWVAGGELTTVGLQTVLGWVRSRAHHIGTIRPVLGLTPAEQVVADLVAAGLTNREIAERLQVSRRTVETHVAHAFQKIGVRSRTQLATAVISARP